MIEFLNEFITFFIEMIVFYFVVQFIIIFIQGWIEAKNVQLEAVVKHLDSIIHPVKIEEQGDMTYWYDAENGNFLAQGRNRDEIIDTLKSRFPKHIFLINQELMAGPEFKSISVTSEDAHKLTVKFK